MATVVFAREGYPRATVTKSGTLLTAVIDDIEGLEPKREPGSSGSDSETARGISSFDPPTVATELGPVELVALAGEAVASSVASTLGGLPINDEVVIRHKVTVAVNGALRELGEDV